MSESAGFNEPGFNEVLYNEYDTALAQYLLVVCHLLDPYITLEMEESNVR